MMTRDDGFNPHRWIIIDVAFIIVSKANAQSFSPIPLELKPSQTPSRTTVFAVLITIFLVGGLLSIYIRQCTRSNLEYSPRYFNRGVNDGYSRRGGLDNAIVESFPVFAYSFVKESKIGSGDLECSICLNELEDRETVRLLPICNHLFHIDCIDVWLHSHATCPVCRSNLTVKSNKSGEEDDGPPLAEDLTVRDHVTIDIDGDSEPVEAAKSDHQQTNSKTSGKFPRSNSTGHSMDRLSYATEKYTLRLPNDVKRRIMAVKGYKLKRTRSFDVGLNTEGSGRFRRSDEENSYTVGSGRVENRIGLTGWVD